MATGTCLKRGTCGDIVRTTQRGRDCVVRDLKPARPGCRWLARLLCRREAAALERLAGIEGVPRLLALERNALVRSWIDGQPIYELPPSGAWFRNALRLLRRMHRAGVAHNDLAKEANWIGQADGSAGVVDFQLASCFSRRSRRFRRLAREDLRHLLKHKACYLPAMLTRRQRALLANPALPARLWRKLFKPPYLVLTRRILRWPERAGAEERQRRV
jgi:RIO-like serine/threonine protein kinase